MVVYGTCSQLRPSIEVVWSRKELKEQVIRSR